MIADTSFLYAFFVPNDPHHAEALAEYRRMKSEGSRCRVPSEVVGELYTAIVYKVGKNEAIGATQTLLRDSFYEVLEYAPAYGVLSFLEQVGQRISYVDGVVIFLSIPGKEKLLCFDDQMLQAVKKVL